MIILVQNLSLLSIIFAFLEEKFTNLRLNLENYQIYKKKIRKY